MIIRRVELSNFGVYSGEHVFDLAPESLNGFTRPVILVSGKNGSGKTTLVEAIRLCLHGSLVIGSRVSKSSYERYLVRRIHVPLNSDKPTKSARVRLLLDYVSAGRRQVYCVERSWELVQERVRQELRIWEDGTELADFDTTRHKESFLRELIPPPVTDIFFFDGERLQVLAGDGTSNRLLADTIKTLFGLNLIEQLQKDLDIYLYRKTSAQNTETFQQELKDCSLLATDLEDQLEHLEAEKQVTDESMTKLRQLIHHQEQRIASEGGWFSKRLETIKTNRQRLEVEIELRTRQAQEMCSGLVPFAIAPEMCRRVAERLILEKDYEKQVVTQQVLKDQLTRIQVDFDSAQFWVELSELMDELTRKKLLSRIEITLSKAIPSFSISAEEVILQLSDRDKQQVMSWIDQASIEVPEKFCQVINRLNVLISRLQQIEQKLGMVPSDETLKPLVEQLHNYNRELGKLQAVDQELSDKIQRVEFERERVRQKLRLLRQQVAQQEHQDQRIQLAMRTQFVLEEYMQELREEKAELLEQTLAYHFNELSHKESLVDAVRVNPKTYEITLYRGQQPFDRTQLSAGERQILAVATIWALRDVSRLPMPVIIDTPLGRLDGDHRLNMIEDYFPRASHQVVLLATDTEIDGQMVSRLTPVISRVYCLDYDADEGKTEVRETIPSEISSPQKVMNR